MKKYLSLLLCLIMILSLFSCKHNEDKEAISSNENAIFSDVNKAVTADLSDVNEADISTEIYESVLRNETKV